MDSRGPTTTARAGAPTAVGGTSRLAQMQMRFQQRQQQERDQRKIEQIATRTTAAVGTVAIASSNGGRTTTTTTTTTSSSAVSATVELAELLNATTLSSSLGAGKVRQMFDERRHRVAGIDKSYPLQPIQSTATVPVAHGNHPVNGNNNSNSNGSTTNGSSTSGNDGGGSGSLARGMAKAGLNNKPRVPPISASSRTRLMQQQSQARGPNLRQDSLVAMQTIRGGDAAPMPMTDANGGYDDNDNFLEQEKFPDAASFDEDAFDASSDRANSLNGNVVMGTKSAKSNGSTAKAAASQKTTKKVPTTPSNTVATRSPNGSAKSGMATQRTGPSVKSNGPSRAVTQPSPASSAGSVRRAGSGAVAPNTLTLANEPVPDGLTRCDICSRNFATERIDKHRQICQKTKTKKRKVFDITKHRVQGTDAESYVLKGKKSSVAHGVASVARKQSSQPSTGAAAAAAAGSKQSNWRKKHEEFIATIRAAKEMKAHLARGGKLSDLPPPPPSENPDYIQCPHCSRRFNQTAAERHIPKCATMLHNKPKPKPKAASSIRRY
uniref:C2HC/C3H-type domain-containing protein n=1 Tax=Anopheles coluzzii TaxID=1518534 RepID=A0A6E8VIL9_ANOCL